MQLLQPYAHKHTAVESKLPGLILPKHPTSKRLIHQRCVMNSGVPACMCKGYVHLHYKLSYKYLFNMLYCPWYFQINITNKHWRPYKYQHWTRTSKLKIKQLRLLKLAVAFLRKTKISSFLLAYLDIKILLWIFIWSFQL